VILFQFQSIRLDQYLLPMSLKSKTTSDVMHVFIGYIFQVMLESMDRQEPSQKDDTGRSRVIVYWSRRLKDAETRYAAAVEYV